MSKNDFCFGSCSWNYFFFSGRDNVNCSTDCIHCRRLLFDNSSDAIRLPWTNRDIRHQIHAVRVSETHVPFRTNLARTIDCEIDFAFGAIENEIGTEIRKRIDVFVYDVELNENWIDLVNEKNCGNDCCFPSNSAVTFFPDFEKLSNDVLCWALDWENGETMCRHFDELNVWTLDRWPFWTNGFDWMTNLRMQIGLASWSNDDEKKEDLHDQIDRITNWIDWKQNPGCTHTQTGKTHNR